MTDTPDGGTVYDYDPRNLSSDSLAAIGLVAACGAQLEFTIMELIGGCRGIDPTLRAKIGGMMTPQAKIDTAREAVNEKFKDKPDTLSGVNKLLSEAENALNVRAVILQSSWFQDPKTTHLFREEPNSSDDTTSHIVPVPLLRLRTEANRIYDAGILIMDFVIRYRL